MTDQRPLRVAIVDDHPMFRLGLAAAINEMDGIELVGEAQRADQVLALVRATSPGVLLLDVRLPDASGLEVNRWVAEHHPEVRVVMLTMSEDLDNATIAHRLFLSPKTVRNHVSNVFSKIQAPDRPGAIVLAHHHGIGT